VVTIFPARRKWVAGGASLPATLLGITVSKAHKRWPQLLFAGSGLLPLAGLASHPPDVMLLIYSLYVAAWFGRDWLARQVAARAGGAGVYLVASFLIAGLATETLAWGNNYLKAAPEPALFHPQLLPDLIIGIGFYGGWACAWLIALRRFNFSLGETFLVTGIQGIFFEQLGAVVVVMARIFNTQPLQAVILGVYVLAVHGSAAGLGMAPVNASFSQPLRSRHWARFPFVVVLMVAFAFAGCEFVGLIAMAFGGLPPKRSIVSHPFW
jgi:hypothetical protein